MEFLHLDGVHNNKGNNMDCNENYLHKQIDSADMRKMVYIVCIDFFVYCEDIGNFHHNLCINFCAYYVHKFIHLYIEYIDILIYCVHKYFCHDILHMCVCLSCVRIYYYHCSPNIYFFFFYVRK